MDSFSYFLHIRRPNYRLVMKRGTSFPPQLDPIDWKLKEERPAERVHREVMKDIERQGFGAYQQDILPEQVPCARVPNNVSTRGCW